MTLRLDTIKGILHWFHFETDKLRSYQSIVKTCRRTLWPVIDDKKAKYTIYDTFYPLLRWGLVEYYGNYRFRLSPTAGIFNSNKILVFNPPSIANEALLSLQLPQHLPGILSFRYSSEVVTSCKAYNIPLKKFDLSQCLYLVPSIGKLIRSWEKEQIVDTLGYLLFNEHSLWVKTTQQLIVTGVYKKSDKNFAGKVIKLSDEDWKTVPDRKQQLDGFALAVLLSRIQNGHDLAIHYLKKEELLVVNTHFFPIILERLLSMNTLLSLNTQADVAKRIYHLDNKSFVRLNTIFHNAIQIK